MGAVGYHVRLATPSIPLAILVQSEDGNWRFLLIQFTKCGYVIFWDMDLKFMEKHSIFT